jgi:hypothetical protein
MLFGGDLKINFISWQPHINKNLVNKIVGYQIINQNSLKRINNCHTI